MITHAVPWYRRTLVGPALAVLLFAMGSLYVATTATVGLGGMISEKLLGSSGVVGDSSLLLGSLANDELSVLGFAPSISTQPVSATDAPGGVTTATLHGSVSSMHGLPTATGYFQWGYSEASLPNTSSTFSVTSTGSYSAVVTGYNTNDRVYYRFVTDADGTSYGNVVNFVVTAGMGGFLIKSLLRLLVAAVICIGVFVIGMRGPGVFFLAAALLGIIAFSVIDIMIRSFF